MSWIINHIRMWFCKHEFEDLGRTKTYFTERSSMPVAITKIYRCKKCGYVQRVRM